MWIGPQGCRQTASRNRILRLPEREEGEPRARGRLLCSELRGGSDRQLMAEQRLYGPFGKVAARRRYRPLAAGRLPAERQLCSGAGHSRPQRELTVSATFRSSRRQRDRDADDRSQGSADVARRMCVARWFPERRLNRCRGHWASKTNRMSAADGAGLTHPTPSSQSPFPEADIRSRAKPALSGPWEKYRPCAQIAVGRRRRTPAQRRRDARSSRCSRSTSNRPA